MPAEDYHADPVEGGSLSSSGARTLLRSAAKYRYELDHPRTSDAFDLGHAAHRLILGTGTEIRVIDADNWRTKAAQEAKKSAHKVGQTPILRKTMDDVEAMAAAIADHPLASKLLAPTAGTAEAVLVWEDPISGVMNRAMLDYLLHRAARLRRIIIDYKTTGDASPDEFAKDVYRFGYHIQGAMYVDGLRAVEGDADPGFLFVVQERDPPYLVNVVELDHTALLVGSERVAQARAIYAECKANDHWPGYGDGIDYVTLPRWAQIREGIA